MSEYEALNLMYLGFTFNAIYTLGFILFTWLGFRMARNIYEDSSATMLGKVFTSIFCLFVAYFFLVQTIANWKISINSWNIDWTGPPRIVGELA